MPNARQIMIEAIRANQDMALGRRSGKVAFARLLQAYPDDGMVYYERGEAYEYRKQYALAEADYRSALERFPLEDWKDVARQALARIHSVEPTGVAPAPLNVQWRLFHAVHTLIYLDHEIRADAISAMTWLDAQPHSTALTLRTCLESLVLTLLDANGISYSDDDDLRRFISLLEEHSVAPPRIRQEMDAIRRLGNKAAHPRRRWRIRSFAESASAFIEVARWANDQLVGSSRRDPR